MIGAGKFSQEGRLALTAAAKPPVSIGKSNYDQRHAWMSNEDRRKYIDEQNLPRALFNARFRGWQSFSSSMSSNTKGSVTSFSLWVSKLGVDDFFWTVFSGFEAARGRIGAVESFSVGPFSGLSLLRVLVGGTTLFNDLSPHLLWISCRSTTTLAKQISNKLINRVLS